jgi:hypothetical protein
MRLFNFLMILGILTVSVACEKKENSPGSDAKLLGITLTSGNAVLDTANNKAILKVAESVDLTKIIPHFEISSDATIYPPSDVATNFTNPVIYTITSEDKSEQYVFTVSAFMTIGRLTVYDCSSWSVNVPRIPQAGATIKIYSSEADFNASVTYDVLTTDQNGKADFYGIKGKGYLAVIVKDTKTNIIDGHVLDGRYDNQEEIDNSAEYPDAAIGGLKFKDVNGDGRVWPDDKYNFDRIGVPLYITGVHSIDLYIATR